jgi:membrane protease YdiL (CAAX protease family)
VLALFVAGHAALILLGFAAAPALGFLRNLAGDPVVMLLAAVLAIARFVVIVPLCIVRWGGLTPGDVGLDWAKVPAGAAATLAVWLLVQAMVAALAFADTGQVSIDPAWAATGPLLVLAQLIIHLATVELLEETVYRGFLLPQLALWLRRSARLAAPLSVMGGVLLSQALFALMHLPLLLALPLGGWPLALTLGAIFIFGLFFAATYELSGNLVLVMGLHLLVNLPASLVATDQTTGRLAIVLAGLLVAGYLGLRQGSTQPREGR